MAAPDVGGGDRGAPAGPPLLFLSHAGADTEAARELKRRLKRAAEARGVALEVWFDKDDLIPGLAWQRQLEEAIDRRATAFAVYLGSTGVVNWVQAEVDLALSRATRDGGGFPFVPVVSARAPALASALPGFARRFHAVRDVENDEQEFEKLLAAALRREVRQQEGEAGATRREAEPFFGLRAIDEERSYLFFGREKETEELAQRLRDQRLLVVVGDSGSGKSSLVRAGLVPRWRGGALAKAEGRRPDEEVWHMVELRPGRDPRRRLGEAVEEAARRLGVGFADLDGMARAAERGSADSVRRALRCGLSPKHARTLVVVDQLEELVTLTPNEQRRPFVELLLELAAPSDEAFSVALTMRRDYYNLLSAPECRPLYDRLEAQDRAALYLLGRMTDDGLRRIVTEPLRLAGVERDEREELAAAVLRDVGERPGDLALAQFALTRAWERRAEFGGSIARAYAGIGRMDGALAREAERVFERELGGEANAAEVSAALIRLARLEGTAGPTRRVARRREFPDGRWALLQTLADVKGNRLVLIGGHQSGGAATNPGDGQETAEIAHEALLTRWPRLHAWLGEAPDDKRALDRMADRVAEWADAATPDAKDKLLAKTDAERETFAALADRRPLWLSAEERAFVEASVADHEARLRWEEEATAERERLLLAARSAEREAIANETRALAALSEAASLQGRYTDALKLALAAWPRRVDDPRPMLERSLRAMGLASEGRAETTPPLRHEGRVLSAVFSPDGTQMLTASSDGTARLWHAATGAPCGQPMRHELPVRSAVFSADGRRVLTASSDGTARVWDSASGGPLGQPMRHEGMVYAAAVSPDGRRVLTALHYRAARLWDTASGAPLGAPMRHDEAVTSAAVSPDGRRVLTASRDGTARLWDAASGAPLGQPMQHDLPVRSAVFGPDGTFVVTVSEDRAARLWDAASGAPLGQPMQHDLPVRSAVFSPDGARVLTASEDRTARLWDAASGGPLGAPMRHEMQHDEMVVAAGFSPDGRRVLTASSDGTTRLWEAASGAQLGEPMRHEGAVRSAVFSPDGARVLTASEDRTARLWDAATGLPLGGPMRHEGLVRSAGFSPDGRQVLTASDDHTARLWDAARGGPLGAPMRHEGMMYAAGFSPDGRRVLTAFHYRAARLWDAASGAPLGAPMRHDETVVSAVFGPDGARVLTASYDHTARLWDAASGAPLGQPMRHEGRLLSAAFSPDGARVLTAARDGTARLWHAATGAPCGQPMRHELPVRSAVFSPDGARVLTASEDRTARLWDAASGAPLGAPMRHAEQVVSAAFSPDGARVATRSCSWGHRARLWDAATGAPVGPPMRHEGLVLSAVFSPDARRLLTVSFDGTARLWDAASGAPLGAPMRHEEQVLSAAFGPDGARVLTVSEDRAARLWDAASGAQIGAPMRHEEQVLSAAFGPGGARVLTVSEDHAARLWDAASGAQIGAPMRHEEQVLSAAFGPGGARVLTVSEDRAARLWDAASGAQIGAPMRHEEQVLSAAFGPDGAWVFTASEDGTARLWDVGWPEGPITAVACALLPDRDVARLAERYGIVIRDPICGPDMPVPDLARLDRQ